MKNKWISQEVRKKVSREIATSRAHDWKVKSHASLEFLRVSLGHAVVEELAGLGVKVHTCTRNEAYLNACLHDWEIKGFQVTGSVCDVMSCGERVKLMDTVSSVFSRRLNILINNVGTNIWKPTVDYTAEEFSTVMTTNLESAYHLCQLAHPLLKASGVGSIVCISSIAGVVALNVGSIYGASKGAINQLTKDLACEWAKDNIRSNCVAPWFIRTPLVEAALNDEQFAKSVNARTPWRAKGGFVPCGLPLPTCILLHNRADYLCGWRGDSEWLPPKT
ncbi:hypothetical protein ACB098_08G053500 [Castanea mollissima]